MPKPLVGHCMAPLNANQVVFAGGYSPEDDDYSDRVDIFDLKESSWIRKPWYYLRTGPRFDGSCMQVRVVGNSYRVVYAGGWNNKGLKESLLFNTDTYKWEVMGTNSTGTFEDALPNKVRSGAMVQLDSIPFLVGGVVCTG